MFLPEHEQIIESLEIRVSSGDLRAEMFRLDKIFHVAKDDSFLLGSRINGNGVDLQT